MFEERDRAAGFNLADVLRTETYKLRQFILGDIRLSAQLTNRPPHIGSGSDIQTHKNPLPHSTILTIQSVHSGSPILSIILENC